MIDPDLLALLICPESHQPLTLADEALLATVNRKIEAGEVTDRSSQRLVEPLTGALVRDDGMRLYAIRDGIPVLLVDEAIDWPQGRS